MILILILLSTFLVSLMSLIGIFTILVNKKFFDRIIFLLVGFAAGGLIGGAFLHLLPSSLNLTRPIISFQYVLIGFVVFFLMERYLYWRHCHNGICEAHSFTYLNLIGDGLHNFTDGLIISASFVTDIKLGVITTLAVIFHEVPQELSDFAILVFGGFSKSKALLYNFICSLTAFFGALLGYYLSNITTVMSSFLIAFTGGGFIYIAASDLIPELHRQRNLKRANLAFIAFLLGIIFMSVI